MSAVLTPEDVPVTPGSPAVLQLLVRNTQQIVESYALMPIGLLAEYVTFEPPTLSLNPGHETQATVTVAVPPDAPVPAGPAALGVRVAPSEQPDAVVVAEAVLHVTPVDAVSAELTPQLVQGRGKAASQVAVDNRGNRSVMVLAEPLDAAGPAVVEAHVPSFEVASGTAEFVDVEVRARDRRWGGPPQTLPFALQLSTDTGAPPLRLDGTFVSQPLLPRWLPRALAVAAAALLALLALWFLVLRPAVTSAAQEAVEELEEQVAEASDQAEAAQQQAEEAQQEAEVAEQAADGAQEVASDATRQLEAVLGPGALAAGEPRTERLALVDAPGGGPGADAELPLDAEAQFGLTDALFQNPLGAAGTLTLSVGDETLYSLGLQNIRDLDLHWVTPIVVSAEEPLTAVIECDDAGGGDGDCEVGITVTGTTLVPVEEVAAGGPEGGAPADEGSDAAGSGDGGDA